MTDYRAIERQISQAVGLTRRPVAVAFRESAPLGIAPFSGRAPSGCSFWRLAGEGRVFYTVAADHYNCAVGSHTHRIPRPPDRANELEQTLSFMTGIGYIKMDEVPAIPQLATTPGVIVYAPLAETPVDPDVALFVGTPGRLMLLQEAALRAGVGSALPALGRPTCMALPAALTHGLVASVGCIGNRVSTDLGEDELYVAVPGRELARLASEAATIASANARLVEYHQGRRKEITR